MRKTTVLLVLLITILPNFNFAQTVQQKIDSLLSLLPVQKNDTNKVDLLVALSREYFQTGPEEGVSYGMKGLELAKELKYKLGTLNAHNAIGRCYAITGRLPEALTHFQATLTIAQEINSLGHIGNAYVSIGNVYNNKSEYDKAIGYFQKAITAYQSGDTDKISMVLNNIGSSYNYQRMFREALDHFKQAAQIEEQNKKPTKLLATIYGNAGGACTGLHQYDEAIKYLFRSLSIHQSMGNKISMVNSLNNIGKTYLDLGKGSYPGLPDSLRNKALNLQKALLYESKATALAEEVGAKEMLPYIYTNMAIIHEARGDYKTALDYFHKYDTINDTLNKLSKEKDFARIEAEFKVKATTDSLQYLADLKDREAGKRKLERNGSILMLSLAGVIAVLLVNRQKLTHKQKHKIAEAENARIQAIAKQQLDDFTKSIQEKNELIEKFSAEIEKYQALPCSNELAADDQSMQVLQSSVILTEDQWVNFQSLFDKVHSGFIQRAKEKYPSLTASELRHLVLTRLELSNKEMAAMLGVSLEAIRTSKHRLLKKINLPDGVTLYEIVQTI